MNENYQASPAGAPPLSCIDLRRILDAARMTDGTWGRTTELAILLPVPAASLVSAPIELIDWTASILTVLNTDGHFTEVAASPVALEAVHAAAGNRTVGQLVTDGPEDDWRNIVRMLGTDASYGVPYSDGVPACHWTFDQLRRSVMCHMLGIGMGILTTARQAAETERVTDPAARRRALQLQTTASSQWAYKLGLLHRPGEGCDFHDSRRRGPRGPDVENLVFWEPAE